MKKTVLSLLVGCVALAAQAKTIDAGQAHGIATDFMHLLNPAAQAQTPLKAPAEKSQVRPYYIYNNAGGGYVIVSGDDRLGQILAYSTDGSVDADALPQGLQGLLAQYTTAVDALAEVEDNAEGEPWWSAPQAVVQPLLGDIEWGQDAPFNTLSPTYSSSGKIVNYYTGCVACAVTQIMRYHCWPAAGTGTKTYTDLKSGKTLTADFGATAYDWANMPAEVPDAPTDAQTAAYSTLAAQMGVALEMQYEPGGSGAYDALVPHALRTYFGYDSAVRSHNRSYYPTGVWMDMIKTELDAGRPVMYGGTSDAGTGGHAFVIDGYDSAGYVHVNWGWYGSSNGWYMINHLDPSSLGIGAGAGGYNLDQDMVTGIRRPVSGSDAVPTIYGPTRFSFDGPWNGEFTVLTYLENLDVAPFSGQLGTLLIGSDDEIVAVLATDNMTIPGFAGGYAGTQQYTNRNVPSTVDASVPDGDYRVALGYRTAESKPWNILRHTKGLPAFSNVVVSHGYLSIISKHEPAPVCALVTPITTDGDLYPGGTGMLRFTMRNESADFALSNVTLRLTSLSDPAVTFDATVSCTVYDQSTETLELLMPVDASAQPGEYALTALVKASGKEYAFDATATGTTTVHVLEPTGSPVVRTASEMVWRSGAGAVGDGIIRQGETFYGVINLRNASSTGKAKVVAQFVDQATGKSWPLIQTEVTFDDSRARTVTFARYVPFDPGTYRVEVHQVADDFSTTAIAPYSEPTVVEVSPSEALVAEMLSFDMPKALHQGQSVDCDLTYRGLKEVRQNLYIRVRQLSNSGGEIVYMGSQSYMPGTEKSLTFKYKPSTSLQDGIYMVIAEAGSSSAQTPLGNHAAYGRVVTMGDVAGIDIPAIEESAVAIWVEGRTLRLVGADGNAVSTVAVYATDGRLVAADTTDLSHLAAGIYIVRARLANGSTSSAKIALQ